MVGGNGAMNNQQMQNGQYGGQQHMQQNGYTEGYTQEEIEYAERHQDDYLIAKQQAQQIHIPQLPSWSWKKDCQGVVAYGQCFFLVHQTFNLETAARTCAERKGKLAVISSKKCFHIVTDYVKRSDSMADKSVVFIWTGMEYEDLPNKIQRLKQEKASMEYEKQQAVAERDEDIKELKREMSSVIRGKGLDVRTLQTGVTGRMARKSNLNILNILSGGSLEQEKLDLLRQQDEMMQILEYEESSLVTDKDEEIMVVDQQLERLTSMVESGDHSNNIHDSWWLSGYPRSIPTDTNVMLQVNFNPYLSTEGLLNAPKQATAYPLCQHALDVMHATNDDIADDGDDMTACQRQYRNVERSITKNPDLRLVAEYPRCEEDGMYSPRQCSSSSSRCWCVNPKTGEVVDDKDSSGHALDCE